MEYVFKFEGEREESIVKALTFHHAHKNQRFIVTKFMMQF